MSELSDVPLDKSGSEGQDLPVTEPSTPALLPRLLTGLLLGVLVGLGYVAWRSRGPAEPTPVSAQTAAPTAAPTAETNRDVRPVVPMPPLGESDAAVRELVQGASSHPAWRSWLALDDLARRLTAAVTNLAAGTSPVPHLRALAPKGPFAVRRTSNRLVIDPASYARYDTIGDVVGSLDTATLATAYRSVEPLLAAAHRELGETGPVTDAIRAVARAALKAPVLDEPVEVHEQGALYAYADASLENRPAAEKQFMRLGPRNLRIVQAKVRDVLAAIGLREES